MIKRNQLLWYNNWNRPLFTLLQDAVSVGLYIYNYFIWVKITPMLCISPTLYSCWLSPRLTLVDLLNWNCVTLSQHLLLRWRLVLELHSSAHFVSMKFHLGGKYWLSLSSLWQLVCWLLIVLHDATFYQLKLLPTQLASQSSLDCASISPSNPQPHAHFQTQRPPPFACAIIQSGFLHRSLEHVGGWCVYEDKRHRFSFPTLLQIFHAHAHGSAYTSLG